MHILFNNKYKIYQKYIIFISSKQTDVVAETNLVIPDSRARLERAYQEFKEVMV